SVTRPEARLLPWKPGFWRTASFLATPKPGFEPRNRASCGRVHATVTVRRMGAAAGGGTHAPEPGPRWAAQTRRRANGIADAGSRPGADWGCPAAVQEAPGAERDEGRAAGARVLREALRGAAAAGTPSSEGDPQGGEHAPAVTRAG